MPKNDMGHGDPLNTLTITILSGFIWKQSQRSEYK